MQVNTLSPLQTDQPQRPAQLIDQGTARPQIDRKPGEPFDVRKADIEIQAKWVYSQIAKIH